MGTEDELNELREPTRSVLNADHDDASEASPSGGVSTPDQTRHNGVRTDLGGTLSNPATSGDIE